MEGKNLLNTLFSLNLLLGRSIKILPGLNVMEITRAFELLKKHVCMYVHMYLRMAISPNLV